MEEEDAIEYCRKLKRKLDQNSYDEVFNTIRYFKIGLISPGCVASKIEALLDGQNDLMESFKGYLLENPSMDHAKGCRNVVCKKMKQFYEGHSGVVMGFNYFRSFLPDKQADIVHADDSRPPLMASRNTQVENGEKESVAAKKSAVEFINKVHKSVNGDEMCKKFLDAMVKYTRHKDLEGLEQEVSALFKASPELCIEFTSFMADTITKQSTSKYANQKLSRSKNNGLKKIEVTRFNQKIMNRFEDDMYEQDMLLRPLESTIETLEELREACEKNPGEQIKVEKYLKVIYLGCIKRYCNESGDNMVHRLHEDPGTASRAILSRLRPIVEELKQKFSPLNKQRAKAIKKLHGRSYDPD